jgi:hypothetical protein
LDKNERLHAENLPSVSAAESVSAVESVNAAERRRKQAGKPSHTEQQPLELTAEEAHEIWGHLSAKVISKLEQGVNGVKVKEGTEVLT